MAKVENPSFGCGGIGCDECPLDDICDGWSPPMPCPRNMEEYAAACELAEKEAQR